LEHYVFVVIEKPFKLFQIYAFNTTMLTMEYDWAS